MPENVAFLIYFFKSFPTVYESSRSDKNCPMQISRKSSGLSDQVETSQNAASDGKQKFQTFWTLDFKNGPKWTLGTPLDESPKKMNNLIDITKSCSHPKPLPDILQWLNITKSMLTGDNHQRQIKQLCSQGISETTYHKLIPHLQDQDGAMKTCKILNGQLASPKTLDEYKSWNSKE